MVYQLHQCTVLPQTLETLHTIASANNEYHSFYYLTTKNNPYTLNLDKSDL